MSPKIFVKLLVFVEILMNLQEKFTFLGGTPLLEMPSTLGYYDPFLPRREGVVPLCLENDLVPLLGHTCRFGGTLPPLPPPPP